MSSNTTYQTVYNHYRSYHKDRFLLMWVLNFYKDQQISKDISKTPQTTVQMCMDVRYNIKRNIIYACLNNPDCSWTVPGTYQFTYWHAFGDGDWLGVNLSKFGWLDAILDKCEQLVKEVRIHGRHRVWPGLDLLKQGQMLLKHWKLVKGWVAVTHPWHLN